MFKLEVTSERVIDIAQVAEDKLAVMSRQEVFVYSLIDGSIFMAKMYMLVFSWQKIKDTCISFFTSKTVM